MSATEDLRLEWDLKKKAFIGVFNRPDKGPTQLGLREGKTFADLNKLLGVAPSDYRNEEKMCVVPENELMQGRYTTNIFDREFSVRIIGDSELEDEKLSQFWQFLPEAVEDSNNFVRLTRGTTLLGRKSMESGFYVRQAYRDLWEIINRMTKIQDSTLKTRFAILGTPGVGKTFFLYYLLWKLSSIKTKTPIVLSRKQCSFHYVFIGEKVSCYETKSQIHEYLNNSECWYLVDSVSAEICDAISVLAISPSAKMADNRQYLREKCLHRYMPTWSPEEVVDVGTNSLGFDEIKLNELYRRWGGVAREVFDSTKNKNPVEEKEELLDAIIGSVNPEKVLRSSTAPDKKPSISDKLIHYSVTADYSKYRTQFASEYVAKAICENLVSIRADRIQSFLRDSGGIADIATVRGNIFERYAHQRLAAGGLFRYRRLRDAGITAPLEEGLLRVTEKKENRFGGTDDLQDGAYLRPKAINFPAIDSLIKPNYFFQMTIAKEHPILCQKLIDAMKRVGVSEVHLFFVVSEDVYPTFINRQKYKGIDGLDVKDQKWGQVQQYALEIKFFPSASENQKSTHTI